MNNAETIPVPCPSCKGVAVLMTKDDNTMPLYTKCKECDGYGYIRVDGCMIK